jgi:hypothetical protein
MQGDQLRVQGGQIELNDYNIDSLYANDVAHQNQNNVAV